MNKYKAAIFDLDGVITKTAGTHAKAWKKMFDAYNEKRQQQGEQPFEAFSIEKDYPKYLDGMPRYDGVGNFLDARAISLPKGNPDDEPGTETVCGLGNWKNEFFQELIESEGVEVYEDNIETIKKWKSEGLRTAVISSSKNCRKILEVTGLDNLFETRVDGVESEKRNIKGKPAPDIFLEAARKLGVKPDEALIVEDALAGVEAGKRGKFKLVVGIGNNAKALRENGAVIAVSKLSEVNGSLDHNLPSALKHFEEIREAYADKELMLCLDYDGTLSEIVEDYTAAVITNKMRELVADLTEKIPLAIVSGRDKQFIKEKVNIDRAFYAGSHGFEISGPDGFYHELDEARELLPDLDRFEEELRSLSSQLEGVEIERKKYAIAIHYRNASAETENQLKKSVHKKVKAANNLTTGSGKKVIEVKPRLDWDKGKAVEMIAEKLENDERPVHIVYIGDDVTDEDAFKVLHRGTGILVGSHDEATAANYRLNSVSEVEEFLQKMIENLERDG